MERYSDEELLCITSVLKPEYQPAAVSAAESILAGRKISPEKMDFLLRQVDHELKRKRVISQTPLSVKNKILAILFPGLSLLIIGSVLGEKGHTNASRSMSTWTLVGVAVWAWLIVLGMGLLYL
jgi:hypothetical protein